MKKIDTTLGRLFDVEKVFLSVANKMDSKVSMVAKYHTGKLLFLVTAEVDRFREERDNLIKSFGYERDATEAEQETSGSLKVWQVKDEHWTEYLEKMKELRSAPVTLLLGPLDSKWFDPKPCKACGSSGINVTALELGALMSANLILMPEAEKDAEADE